jgi:hypothetical protein
MDKSEFATDDMKSVMFRIMQMMEESEQDFPTSPAMTDRSYPESVASESSVHTVQYQELANLSKVEVQQEQPTPSPTKKISTKQFLTKTLARMNNRTQKSIEQLKKTKEKVEEEISAVCTHKPSISDASKLKAKEQAPLHERYKAYLQEKNKKLSEITAKVVEEREKVLMKDLTFKPKIITLDDEKKRTVEQVASGCEEWREKKLKDIEMIKEKILEEEKQNLTFRPELNKNSLEIWLRMKEEGKLPEKFGFDKSKSSRFQIAQRESKKDLLFRPQIRKTNPNLNKSASSSVFERLFPGGNVKLLNTLVSNPLLTSNSSMNLSLSKTDRSQFNRSSSPGYHEHPSPDPHQKQVDPRHKLNASISVTTLHEPKKYIKPVISEKPVKSDPKPIKKIIEKPKSEKRIIEKPKPEKKFIEKPKPEKKTNMTRSQTTPKLVTKKPAETQQKPSVSIEDEFLAAKLRMEAARLERQEATERTNAILLTSIQEERSKYSEIISSKVEVDTASEITVATTEKTSVTIEATSEEAKKKFNPNVDYVTKAMEEGLLSKGVFSSYDIRNPSNIYTHYTSRASDASEITSTSNENKSEEICL